CHGGQKGCTLPIEKRQVVNDNCFQCHMPVSEAIDIPHVTVHDHRIHVPVTNEEKNEIQKFTGIECMTTTNPSALLMTRGYLQTFEAFSPQPYLLDSALHYLQKADEKKDRLYIYERIRYYYLKNDFGEVVNLSAGIDTATIRDSWTAYRIGEGNYQAGDFGRALMFYQRAANLK